MLLIIILCLFTTSISIYLWISCSCDWLCFHPRNSLPTTLYLSIFQQQVILFWFILSSIIV